MRGQPLGRLALGACISLVTAAVLAGSASPRPQATLAVRVDARDFAFTLSRTSVPAGSTVRFVVRNRGRTPHRFQVNGKRTKRIARGTSQTLTVRFPKRGSFRFLCTVPNHAAKGMRGSFAVRAETAPPTTEPPAEPPVTGSVAVTQIATAERPVHVTGPPGDDTRLFVVTQTGLVRVIRNGELLERPFLDLSDRVRTSNESGLLSLVFAPDYASSGLFYVVYNQPAGNGTLRLAEWRRHPTDPDLADPFGDRTVLEIEKPWENHNGGMLQFGPDGYLYMSVGDGDSGVVVSPGFFSQRLDSLLGKIIRIDPRGAEPYAVPSDNPFVRREGARPEIWAYGLRNPWRFWIDPDTGAMFIGDPGAERREEISLVPPGQSGLNFGWPCNEGGLGFDPSATCDDPVWPLVDIARADGVCAVIGGVVVRDARLAALTGRYLYGDFCLGRITAIRVENGEVVATDDLGVEVPRLSSFGADAAQRIYATSTSGAIWRLDPRPAG